MPSNRERDDNGYLLVKGCPITSYGIFDYGAGQLDMPGDPNRIVKVFRPEDAVKDPSAIESFKNVPLIDDHAMLSGFNGDKTATAPEDYGVAGVLTSNIYYDAPWMRGDLKVFSREMQQALQKGKKDLSLGYSCDFIEKPGVWNNQPYEVVQMNMRGNHIALVDEGRVPGARVLDGLVFDHMDFVLKPTKFDKGVEMKPKGNRVALDNAVEQLKALLPALEQFLNEEAVEPNHSGAGAVPPEGGGEEDAGAAVPVAPPAAAVATEAAPPPTEATSAATPPASGGESPAAPPAEATGGGEGGSSMALPALVTEIEGILAKIKAAMGGGKPMSGGDSGDDGGADAVVDAEGGEPPAPTEVAADQEEEEVKDSVTGLAGENAGEGAAVCADEPGTTDPGQASPGPAAGTHSMAGDTVLKEFYADLAAKTVRYERLSRVVGAFDCRSMDAAQVCHYGVKKLNIKCAKGTEEIALDAYLNAVEAAAKDTNVRVQKRAEDTRLASDELDQYLNA